MEGGGGNDFDREEDDAATELLKDRFKLSTISIVEAEEELAKDLELFAYHAGRKCVNMEDVILSAHRNEHLATSLRSLCNELKGKEPQSEKKRKKTSRKEDKATTSVLHIS